MSDTFYLAAEEDAEGFDLSRFISLLGIEPVCGGSFRPDSGAPLGPAWEIWQTELFLPVLAPAFVTAFQAASAHRIQEIVTCDQSLDQTLSGKIPEWSRLAGEPFLQGKQEMRGHREWARFAEQVESGNSPGHLCVLFALQSALYHLALPAALSAYAFYEFQSRLEKFPFPLMTEEESEAFLSVMPRIPLAVRSNATETDGENGMLRAL
ncbi:MAG: urease accessory UreF family protein [Verrucomicrobiota bacterium]